MQNLVKQLTQEVENLKKINESLEKEFNENYYLLKFKSKKLDFLKENKFEKSISLLYKLINDESTDFIRFVDADSDGLVHFLKKPTIVDFGQDYVSLKTDLHVYYNKCAKHGGFTYNDKVTFYFKSNPQKNSENFSL